MTHTPGPWYPYLDRLGGRHIGSGQVHIATIGSALDPDQADADARFIALLPDMEAALKFAHIKIQLLCQELGRSTDADTQQIVDILNKIEGEL